MKELHTKDLTHQYNIRVKSSIIPNYAYAPLLMMFLVNILVYFGTRLFTEKLVHHDISLWLDYKLPFLPVFVIPYILSYIQWIIGYIQIARVGQRYSLKVFTGEIISKLMVCLFFIFFPTTMRRVTVEGMDIFSRLVSLIYRLDAPTNLFPSIHCLESYICMRAALEIKSFGKGYKLMMVIMSMLVFLSTLFIKQHVILDFFGAVLVAEAGRAVSDILIHHFYKNSYNQ
ncbi:hypothetical protein [Oribacterium sp. WCC10]|uniref:hypothetical protein n=1 Tax=Oribacterium sp. WCC10 TaxID=1855343 RepID=UPI0008EA3E84|nr:hypothetical protein [Oribacterium sp. WCC10]SFG20699.1 hypothetical protein SAMN05216356_103143 [Oribacterium sp. WCC10]